MKAAPLLIFLILLALSFAVEIKAIEEKETSAIGTGRFDISISYDCDRTIEFSIKSAGTPVEGATVFVFYEERYTSLLGTGRTDAGGRYAYEIIGDPKNMRHLFLATVEKSGFRTKEAHFVLPEADRCVEDEETGGSITSNETVGETGAAQQNESAPEETELGQQAAEEKENESAGKAMPGQNQTANNGTAEGKTGEQGRGGAFCAHAFLLAALSLFIVRRRSSRI